MKNYILYAPGNTAACRVARRELIQRGIFIAPEPAQNVSHLLLSVPSFESDGRIRGGGILEHILADLPESVTVIGGNLKHPQLETYPCIDLLRDDGYVAQNAAITADCAIRVASQQLTVVWEGCPVLIVGWGRIGKCLAALLKAMGARVSVACRKESDRAIAQALGYSAENTQRLSRNLCPYRVIFNTVPAPVLDREQLQYCQPGCIKIDLASQPGMIDDDVICARGLPGKMAPESSGILIAKTVIRLLSESEVIL